MLCCVAERARERAAEEARIAAEEAAVRFVCYIRFVERFDMSTDRRM